MLYNDILYWLMPLTSRESWLVVPCFVFSVWCEGIGYLMAAVKRIYVLVLSHGVILFGIVAAYYYNLLN